MRKDTGAIELAAVGELDAPPAEVQAALLDYAAHPRINKNLAESTVLSRTAGELLVYQHLKLPVIKDRDFTLRVSFNEGVARGSRFRIDGSQGPAATNKARAHELLNGRWDLEPIRGGTATRAVYHVQIDFAGSRSALDGARRRGQGSSRRLPRHAPAHQRAPRRSRQRCLRSLASRSTSARSPPPVSRLRTACRRTHHARRCEFHQPHAKSASRRRDRESARGLLKRQTNRTERTGEKPSMSSHSSDLAVLALVVSAGTVRLSRAIAPRRNVRALPQALPVGDGDPPGARQGRRRRRELRAPRSTPAIPARSRRCSSSTTTRIRACRSPRTWSPSTWRPGRRGTRRRGGRGRAACRAAPASSTPWWSASAWPRGELIAFGDSDTRPDHNVLRGVGRHAARVDAERLGVRADPRAPAAAGRRRRALRAHAERALRAAGRVGLGREARAAVHHGPAHGVPPRGARGHRRRRVGAGPARRRHGHRQARARGRLSRT